MALFAIAVAIAVSSPGVIAPAQTQLAAEPDAKLAVASLARGREEEAIRELESELAFDPDDPALLINLGIAHAHRGDESKARELFKAAMASDDVIELESADGSSTDSRRLARKALAMLERGEFRPVARSAETLTLRE